MMQIPDPWPTLLNPEIPDICHFFFLMGFFFPFI